MSGWSSWLKSGDDSKPGSGASTPGSGNPNFRPVSDAPQEKLFGPLEQKDLEWTCAGGFTTETQTWYTILQDGSFATSQIIHSAVGLWYPQIQITFKYFNPKTGQKVWKSVNVSKFTTPPPAGTGQDKSKTYDKRSVKAEQFSVLFDSHADGSESYAITANMDTDLQLSYTFTRPAECAGWKLGAGPKGGMSFFGSNESSPDGYVVHRFWPRAVSSGHIIHRGAAIDAKGQGMFVHAIQGMRPNLVASRWNFANFQSAQLGGVAGIMMEFTTTPEYGGPKASGGSQIRGAESSNKESGRESMTVNIGSITVGSKLVAVTASTRGSRAQPSDASRGSASGVTHLNTTKDPDTGYAAPQAIKYVWEGPLQPSGELAQKVLADLTVQLGKPSPVSEAKGLVDKVDVLAEIPYVVRKVVNYVAGTKPYIYQTLNPATMNLTLPGAWQGELSEGSSDAKADGSRTVSVDGTIFEEHTFISDS